ncbi:MAG TPA: cytochrome c [Bacteroidales bacterium]|nr:cytochrome c [Bacteroidales bacterium]
MKFFQFIHCIFIVSSVVSCGNSPNESRFTSSDTQIQRDVTRVPESLKKGEQEYAKYCLTCHQADGNGVRGQFPPLAGNQTITGPADSLVKIVLLGLQGPIEVNGQTQNYSQIMPAQDYLTDDQIADVLTYIRNSWGNKAPEVKPGLVAKIRNENKIKQ